MKIHPKVITSTIAGAMVGIATWVLKTYAHVDIPLEIQAELITVTVFAAGWITPSGTGTNNGA